MMLISELHIFRSWLKKVAAIAVLFSAFLMLFLTRVSAQTDEIERLKTAIAIEKDSRIQVDSMLKLVDLYKYAEPHLALETAKNTELKSEEINYQMGLLKSKRLISGIYWSISDYQKAMQYAVQSLSLAEKLEAKEEKAIVLRTIGIILSDLGEAQKSAEYFFESLKLYEELNDKDGLSKAYNSIGNAYATQGNKQKAGEYYNKSLVIARGMNDLAGVSRCLNNIATIHLDESEHDYLRNLLFEAVRINRQIGQKYWEAINYMNIGDIFFRENLLDSAYNYYLKSEKIFSELNNIPRLASNYLQLSKYFASAGRSDESLRYANMSLQLGIDHQLPALISNASEKLADLYLSEADSSQALKYALSFHAIKDSLNAENNLARITQLEMVYELEKLEQERKLQNQKKEFRYTVAILLLIFIGLAFIILLVARHRIHLKNEALKRQQLRNELDLKNKELTLNVMSLMKKNEVLSDIATKLMQVQKEAVKDETKTAIRKVIKELKKMSETQVLQEFEVRFKQVHGDFYQKLVQKFSDLTPNELKLCAFMRLNLSTKDISELTGQRVATIEIARSRLRKKLGIAHSQITLVNFLSQI
jgi:tetratricopeptide (TPR) repeat protein